MVWCWFVIWMMVVVWCLCCSCLVCCVCGYSVGELRWKCIGMLVVVVVVLLLGCSVWKCY